MDTVLTIICAAWALIASGLMLVALIWPSIDTELAGFDLEIENVGVIAAVVGVGFVAAAGVLATQIAGLFA